MPSLMECIVSDLEEEQGNITLAPEDLLAQFDLDAMAISTVEGSWEQINVGDRISPVVEGLNIDDFHQEGPSVYQVDGYTIVRGREESHAIFFVYDHTM